MQRGAEKSFNELCESNCWRRTAQRREVYCCLMSGPDHPNVETVWRQVRDRLPYVSLDSVYRILDEFAAAGALRRLESGQTRRYDVKTHPHDHFVCSVCGGMFDLRLLDAEGVSAACAPLGTVTSVELLVRGVCKKCQRDKS